PIDSYIEFKLKEHSAATAPSRRRKNRELLPAAQPRLYLLNQLEALKDRLKDINYEDPDAPEDHLVTHVNLAHSKLAEYYEKFDNAPVYYAATILHPHYKNHLAAL
ncbi:hypothetical protein L13192_02694, partial [Pyrenophora tritici-repentis]